jgi:hypothetical protein
MADIDQARVHLEGIERLILALKAKDERAAEQAAAVLGTSGHPKALKPLIDYCLLYSPLGGYRNDPGAPYGEQARIRARVGPLEELVKLSARQLAEEDLQTLHSLNDSSFFLRVDYDTPGYGSGADDFTVVLNFARIRDLAARESRRRQGC